MNFFTVTSNSWSVGHKVGNKLTACSSEEKDLKMSMAEMIYLFFFLSNIFIFISNTYCQLFQKVKLTEVINAKGSYSL